MQAIMPCGSNLDTAVPRYPICASQLMWCFESQDCMFSAELSSSHRGRDLLRLNCSTGPGPLNACRAEAKTERRARADVPKTTGSCLCIVV